jgi:hypothetical protein
MATNERFAAALRVKGWEKRYENNRTRGLKRMEWVPVPNRMDGDGFTELMDHPNGITHFGCWNLCLQVASRCQPRGVLIRTDGRPHDAVSLARITRVPASAFVEAIPRLLTIGWLETFTHDGAAIPHEGAGSLREGDYGREGNGSEQNGTAGVTDDEKNRLLQGCHDNTLTSQEWARLYEVCSDQEIEGRLGGVDFGPSECIGRTATAEILRQR